MEIDELKSRKAQLENDITDLIAKFEEDCNVEILSCYYSETITELDNFKSCRRKTSITVKL